MTSPKVSYQKCSDLIVGELLKGFSALKLIIGEPLKISNRNISKVFSKHDIGFSDLLLKGDPLKVY